MDKELEAALEANKQFPNAKSVTNIWRKKVEKTYDHYLSHPWMDNVPLKALRIGEMKIIAWLGEPFCSHGLKLQEKWPDLMTIGYANGRGLCLFLFS